MDADDRAEQDSGDEELAAMARMDRILRALSSDSAARAIRWIAERYGVGSAGSGPRPASTASIPGAVGVPIDLAELFAQANPGTLNEKALVASYWFQAVNGTTDLDAQTINTELKQLGHGIKNITAAFAELISSRPQLAIQVRKAGNTKQARKRYRLTTEGLKRVRLMLGEGAVQSE